MSFPVSKSNMKMVRKSRRDRKFRGFRPQLTSLVDVMTILLIYLLKSFSAEGEIVTMSKDLMLPESSAQKPPKLTVTLAVNRQDIIVESTPIAEVQQVLASEDLLIPELAQWLNKRREATELISQYSDKTSFEGDITIQGDKRIRFRLLEKIMYTCGQEGFNNFMLAVRQKEL